MQRLVILLLAITLSDAAWTQLDKSVIAGRSTHFARQLPETLRVDAVHRVPDATHRNLRFWFTPDSFEQDNTADDTPVSTWRNVAQLGVTHSSGVQTLHAEPRQSEQLRQPIATKQPRYKKNVINGRGAVHFSRASDDGTSGQFMEMYNNPQWTNNSGTGFDYNPFTMKQGSSGASSSDNTFTVLLVARTSQSNDDTGEMGILRLSESSGSQGEGGMYLAKSCSTCINNGGTAPNCFQGKYGSLSTLNAAYGQTPAGGTLSGEQQDVNNCANLCTSGCDLNNIPPGCKSNWGPPGSQNLQDPDKSFRIIAIRASAGTGSKIKLGVYVDGFHASSEPPMYISGTAEAGFDAPAIARMLVGVKISNNGTNPQYMTGDIAEMMIYDAALTNLELDRLGSYLSKKYALPYMRLDSAVGSPSRSVPLSCSSCVGPGPIGEGGVLQDGGVSADSCYDARGTVGSVYSTSMFNLSTGVVIQDHVADGFKHMYITVCNGACTASSSGIINNIRGSPAKILSSSAQHDGIQGVNVTLETQIPGVSYGDGYIINNAHKVKLADTTNTESIGASDSDDFYTYEHGMHIMFRGSSRCAGRAARILAYDKTNKCATIGSNDEVGDYKLATAVSAADQHPSNGMCKGGNCDGPSVGGIRGAGSGHVSSIKLLVATAGCSVGVTLEAVAQGDGAGSGFKAVVDEVSGGAISKIRILSSGSGYTTAPKLKNSDSNCVCQGNAFNTDASNGDACLRAILGTWSDGGAACVAGGGGHEYVIVKEKNVGAAVATGVLRGSNYIEGGAYTVGPSAGGSQVRIKGAYLFPNDMHAAGDASVTNVQRMTGPDVTLNLEYLQVLIDGKEATGCTLYTYPRGVDPARTNRSIATDGASTDISGLTELPEIRCAAPAGVGSGDLTVSWHGIPITISGWWKFDAPMVTEVEPAHVPYTGGALITVSGQNFGPKSSWSKGNSGEALGVKAGRVEILGWGVSTCSLVTYVSDSELVCRVPALSMRTHPVDKAASKVRVQVVVSTGAQRSIQGQASQLEYTSVPSYYSCQTTPRDACFRCCRSSCVVESFAEGQTNGFYKSCDSQCYQFCGFGAVH